MAIDHRGMVCDDFLNRDLHAECACGWVGPQAKDWQQALADHQKHLADSIETKERT